MASSLTDTDLVRAAAASVALLVILADALIRARRWRQLLAVIRRMADALEELELELEVEPAEQVAAEPERGPELERDASEISRRPPSGTAT